MGKYTDVMIDLETLGTRPGSVITQIGLCAFNTDTTMLGMATLLHVKPQSQIDRGFLIDWDTIGWWLTQEDSARAALVAGQDHAHDIEHALESVHQWFAEYDLTDAKVWGHGATFDVTQLEIAFSRFSLKAPWGFRNVRDTRTLADLPAVRAVHKPVPTVAHDALEDACSQAIWVMNMMATLRAVSEPEPALQP